MHRSTVDRFVVVVAPAALDTFRLFVSARRDRVELAVQDAPTGMLDAIVRAAPIVAERSPRRVAITWCDQIALSSETIARVHERSSAANAAALVLPTLIVDDPYVHFDRDAAERIVRVRQRREGDSMPPRGETDMGLFDLSLDAYLDELAGFSRQASADAGTGERNFLPFIPWLAARAPVETVSGRSRIETIGVNTPDELATIEAHLAGGGRDPR
jgi:bifunctional UDP-N-acetylglucosamine pyrophosphorylase/glucosamine-1-phosphate N-acetyltransferase